MIAAVRFGRRLACGLLSVCALIAAPAAFAAMPSNPHDPCVKGTRDVCNTTGVGFYRTYRYGTRWFGDFRNAVPGTAHTYCIDLRFWYPGAAYRYQEDTGGKLANKDGKAVPLPDQQRIAYAIWEYGRTSDPDQAAAVMLYVHSQMGDARPGEVDPSAAGSRTVSALYDRISRDAKRYHGPYRVEVTLPSGLKAGSEGTATVRVLAAGGAAVPGQPVKISAQGLVGAPGQVTTDANGVARLTVTPSGGPVKLGASAGGLPSTLPRVFVPTSGPAAPNGQRLVLPSAQTVAESATATATKRQIRVSTSATPATVLVGQKSQDRVTISNAAAGWSGTVEVRVYGPARSASAITCAGAPVAQATFSAKGNGAFSTPAITLGRPGWYAYEEVVPGDSGTLGLTTPCNAPSERVRVDTQPQVVTTVSSQNVAPGTPITDTVEVTGLAGEQATVQAALYGPYASRAAVTCTGTPAGTGTIPVTADGTFTTQPFTVTTPGYYTYRESIAAAGFVRAVQTACADVAETTIVTGKPKVVTHVSAQEAAPGASIRDKVVVSGLGALEAEVKVELWGPASARTGVRCTGTPYWQGTLTVNGDGAYTTAAVKIAKAGYFAFRESILDTPAYAGFTGACGEATETTFVRAGPSLTTQATSEVARAGSKLSDRVTVRGLGKTAARIEVTLYGPFATRAAIGCSGSPAGTTSVTAHGDGTVTTPGIKIAKAGFYVFREHLVGSAAVRDVLTGCTEESEVSLVAPLIITGRGDVTHEVRARGASTLTPTRVTVASVGIDAPASPVGIDLAGGILGVTSDIHRTAWWADGAKPGDRTGAVLIAGHVDSATRGAGAFFHVKDARPGQHVELATAGGRTFTYRVVSVRSYPKTALPTSVWSRRGPARLVLVTCGGPFDRATGHYRDNIVLTAVPV
jgi:hypothetical protein